MELLGENLSELRRNAGGKFDLSTTLQLGKCYISVLEEIHNLGHIHRDIKPSNFAIGLQGENRRKIFLIDWGLARRYVSADGSVRAQRNATGFRGTARYASINSHAGKDLSRRDDLWSVFYILVEFSKGSLPWRRLKDKDKIGEKKIELNNAELVRGLPDVFTTFMDYLQLLAYDEKPDYNYLKTILNETLDQVGTGPFPWEGSTAVRISSSGVSTGVALMSSEDSVEAGSGPSSGGGQGGLGRSTSASHSKPESTGSSSRGATGAPPQKFILLRGKGDVGSVSAIKPTKTLIGTPYLAGRPPSNPSLPSSPALFANAPSSLSTSNLREDRESVELDVSLPEEQEKNRRDRGTKRRRSAERLSEGEDADPQQQKGNEDADVVIDTYTNKENSEADPSANPVEGAEQADGIQGKKKRKRKKKEQN